MIYSLDTETGPFDPSIKVRTNAWALEPYRKEFYVKMVGVAGPDGYDKVIHKRNKNMVNDVLAEVGFLANPVKRVYCHNAIFDIAVLMRVVGIDNLHLARIKWRDTGLLAKWINNSQKDERFIYSLRNCIDKWLPEGPEKDEFLALKDNMEVDESYWLERVIADCHRTRELAIDLEALLPPEMLNGYIIECACLYPLAKGWYHGIHIDPDKIDELEIIYKAKANKLLRELGLSEATVRSSAKLGKVLFEDWGLEPHSLTATGKPCTAAADLKYIALESQDEHMVKLLEAKQALTIVSKYANGYQKAIAYGDGRTMHPTPRLFNSYTGRMTYTSKLTKKFQVGIALHQLPRKAKEVKRCMVAPPGYKFLYMDYAAQELRIMAIFSNDKVMLKAFSEGKDLHSIMTESIYGTSYETIVAGNQDGIPLIVDQRNCGKLTNLSSMYRIGGKALKEKFFEQYDKMINLREANHFLNSYKKSFQGIPRYWTKAIGDARRQGYVESLSGRRFHINKLDWQGESSAINMPIQGTGADLSELAIAVLSRKFPRMIFQLAVHDSLTWLIPEDNDPQEVKAFMDNFDFNEFYKKELPITFPFDFAYGDNLADMEALK